MIDATIQITGITAYSQSKPHREVKQQRETADAYEARTWKKRMHLNENGQIIMPAMALKNCLAESAKYLGMQVPGKGKSTYTKSFEAGILILEDAVIYGKNDVPLTVEDCDREGSQVFGDWIFTPSDGVAGSGKRVYKCYPVIKAPWHITQQVIIVDDLITEDVLAKHLEAAGMLIGLGRWRPRNRGMYGRFKATIQSWNKTEVAA